MDIENISLYSFKKELEQKNAKEKQAKFWIENVSNEDHSLLELLGVKNSSIYLSNCTIWVEGITDRYYLRHYLDLYQKSIKLEIKDVFKEDIHFSFVEYSGNNITHWSFLDDDFLFGNEADNKSKSMNAERLCGRLFLITDLDSEKSLPRQEKLAEKLKERYYCLNCKEIENLLSKKVLINVIALYEKVDPNEVKFKRSFSEDTYKNKYLGKFIDNNLLEKRRKAEYGNRSGTINEKVKFCFRAMENIKSIEDMTEEAIVLTKKVFEFIKVNNQ